MSKISELRAKFLEGQKRDAAASSKFDPRDLDKVNNDTYLTRVVEHCEGDVDNAVKMLWTIMTWRSENKANDINDVVNMAYVKEGLFFPHGRDLDGCLILIIKWKNHTKGQKSIDDHKKLVVYWLERLEREEGKPFTLFFDLDGCSMSNIETEVVVYMINLLKTYYPKFINQIIIFQMPWIMSAGYRILKGLLPAEAVKRLRVVNKDKLGEYVAPDQALKCWGGKNDYTFHFVPEKTSKKHVTFADRTEASGSVDVIPGDYLTFKSSGNEFKSEFTIINPGETSSAFKVRTTGPEKFRVKPRSGILAPNSRLDVSIAVMPGIDVNVAVNERFLVLATLVSDDHMPLEEIFQVAKATNEYRLKCQLVEQPTSESPVIEALNTLHKKHLTLSKSLDCLKLVQIMTLSLTTLSVTFGYLVYGSISN